MNERFRVTSNPKYLSVVFDERKKRHYVGTDLEDLLNGQDKKIKELETENERLRKENFFLDYWKKQAMTLLMQVRRLTSRMTDQEIKEFSKELEECISE